MTFEAAEDCCIAAMGSLGPNPNICCRCINGMWGWTGWLLPYPGMLGCEGEAETICCLLLLVLLFTIEGPTPGTLMGEVTPAGPHRADIKRARSAAILCLVLSTCSHSFIKNVSTSANCFSFSSNLFNWWFTIFADSLWISRSSWSANSFAFVAAAARPALAAALTFSADNGTCASFWLHEPCSPEFSSEAYPTWKSLVLKLIKWEQKKITKKRRKHRKQGK
jgi:hypothetical protein